MEDDDLMQMLLEAEAEIEIEKLEKTQKTNNEIITKKDKDSFAKATDSNPINGFSNLLNKSLQKAQSTEAKSILDVGDHANSSDDEDFSNFLERKYNEYGEGINSILKQKNQEQIDAKIVKNVEANINKNQRKPQELPKPHQFPVYNPQPKVTSSDVGIYTDPIFGIRIIHPLISSSMLQERMQNRIAVSTAGIPNHVNCYDLSKDWAIAGVILSKGPVSTSKKGSQYVIWKLSDLRGDVKKYSLFLFQSACKDLWKTAVGMVVAVLNPKVMDRSKDSTDIACLSIDTSQKFMILGQSKDLGHCKSKKKNGDVCNAVVNLNTCEYCIYHVKQEYGKMSGRSELQSATSGRGLEQLRNKVLGKCEVFYGGQSFTAVKAKKNPKLVVKDQKRLLTLSEYYQSPNRPNSFSSDPKKVDVVPYAEATGFVSKVAAGMDTSIKQRQQDIDRLRQLSGKDAEKGEETTSTIKSSETPATSSPSQFSRQFSSNTVPQLKKEGFSFELSVSLKKSEISKTKALEILKKKPIAKSNPNFVKYRGTEQGKKRALDEIQRQDNNEQESKKQKLDEEAEKFRNERIKKIMEITSSHKNLIEQHHQDAAEKYFDKMERKEAMEEKMLNTFKVNCKAVICLKCKYSAFSAADRCKDEKHPLKVIDGEKRFFQCLDCGNRTATLHRIPKMSCKNCQSSRWQRTAMIKERKIAQAGEELSIRGDEEKFLGSLKSRANIG